MEAPVLARLETDMGPDDMIREGPLLDDRLRCFAAEQRLQQGLMGGCSAETIHGLTWIGREWRCELAQ